MNNYENINPIKYQELTASHNNSMLCSEELMLTKVSSHENDLYCGYSNGVIVHYANNNGCKSISAGNVSQGQYNQIAQYHPYQNAEVIDLKRYDDDVLLTCTHTEVTLFNVEKNKSIQLKGHQTTPIAISAHPVSPVVISVSNAIIQHDIRAKKPINVNFITPPAFDIEYFADGKEFLLSGEPIRIGRCKWIRTLLGGIGKCSLNSKYVVSNNMNGSISLWNWRQSEQLIKLQNVKNKETYQPIHFGMKNANIQSILFLEENGSLLKHDILKKRTYSQKLMTINQTENWKMVLREVDYTTKAAILYEHEKAVVKVFDL